MNEQSTRTPTPVDAVAEEYLSTLAGLHPIAATMLGLPGHDDRLTDFSPDGHAARAEATRHTLAALDGLAAVDETDRVTIAAMRQLLGLDLEMYEAGETEGSLNVIESPVQGLRDVFDVTPTSTEQHWADVAARLAAMPDAVEGYIASLRAAADRGVVAAARQVAVVADQAAEQAGEASFFPAFVTGQAASAALTGSAGGALRADLERGAGRAQEAYARLERFLREELAPRAGHVDAVGRERYERASRHFVGATLDLDETYAWGVEELARVSAEQEAVAREIAGPGASVADAVAALDADPARRLVGTAALREWMQATADSAIAALDGTHFDIAPQVRRLECMIAPTQTGGIYYTGPSDDFSRPGRMWWSVPADVTEFNTWRERTTVYHEGVPGHHLQIGTAVANRDRLNAWRRLACWTSGYGEGWALYAERLMADLGFLDDPGDRFGMLDGQRMRAARVVFDLGVHLGLPAPEQYGGGTWDADKGWALLVDNVNMSESFLRFEWLRYLGWPGQAPSYKVGQRLWEQIRDDAASAATARGETFDIAAFHARALSMGSLPLDVLKVAMAE
ncbi:DUF885 domain-containing protein [Cellulomonas citrea]|uniref:DUF885 domain-containing protein n=1 Tax=Cellulomonas citrea TaxID=1909423 RepID=UPI001F1F038C|nr:DUF885 domain-containing protein [Cellulomonas citrea]